MTIGHQATAMANEAARTHAGAGSGLMKPLSSRSRDRTLSS